MKLKAVHVQNFRCIEDSNEFTVSDITCLVGKNESGKSALLQALYKLNPDRKNAGSFNDVQDYPRRLYGAYSERLSEDTTASPANVLTTRWELDEADVKTLTDVLGENSVTSTAVTVEKGYSNTRLWTIGINELETVKRYLDEAGLYSEERTALANVTTIDELFRALESNTEPSPPLSKLLERLRTIFSKKDAHAKAREILATRLPTFLYFADYQKMPGQVAVEALLARKNANTLGFSDDVFLALLDLSNTSPEDIQAIAKFEEFVAKLEAVSNRITEEIFEYWSQNTHLQVEFRVDPARPEDPVPFNTGTIFRTRIRNNRHRVTVSFDERSAGFVWFFSFLVWFSQVRKRYGQNLILLLDEPGLQLHAKAQEDLLRYMNERLKPSYQVIYTTHSPFMIDPENLLGARTVEDVVENGKLLGTKVGDKVLSTDSDTLAPLQAAIGYGFTQTLFVGKYNLLVEGPSDLLYIKWFSHELQLRKREFLDPRWTIVPSGGVDKIISFVTMFSGSKLDIAVMTDYAEGEKRKIRSLRESELLKQGHVFGADMYTPQPEADVEDMLGRALYIDLVNKAYDLKRPNAISDKKPTDAPIRVVKEVEDKFALMPPAIPSFDHFLPSSYLTEHGAELRSTLPELDVALDRFEAFFRDVNALLPAR